MDQGRLPYKVEPCYDFSSSDYNAVVLVTDSISKVKGHLHIFYEALERRRRIDSDIENDISIIELQGTAPSCLIFSPTGPITRDQDDVRCFCDAMEKGVHRAIKAGHKNIIIVRVPDNSFPNADIATILAALHAVYVPLEFRESKGGQNSKIYKMGIWGPNAEELQKNVKVALAIENGRFVCRDIGGSDPERMAAPNVKQYVREIFKGSVVQVKVIDSLQEIEKAYPLLAAVNRASKDVKRHQACVIHLTYTGDHPIDTTLMMVGKGVTYDTGGADLKVGGGMAGMHRDKCGAAAVAGFFLVLSLLKPKGIKVIGIMSMSRNSIGSDCYVSDEIITSRSGMRVRVGNTDAEGRMIMADPLCELREMAINEINPHLFTIATLTGHAELAVGPYSIVIDNGPAHKERFAFQLQETGERIGDPLEVSILRREDYNMIKPQSDYEDIIQCNNLPSSRTQRGHQYPAAFLIEISLLDKHGNDSNTPIKYSHLDIGGSHGEHPDIPTATPIAALSFHYLVHRI